MKKYIVKESGSCVIFGSYNTKYEASEAIIAAVCLDPERKSTIFNFEVQEEEVEEFHPFQKVLVRDSIDYPWTPAFFGTMRDSLHPYKTIGGCRWNYCIPYEGNEHLLGTKESPEK